MANDVFVEDIAKLLVEMSTEQKDEWILREPDWCQSMSNGILSCH